jgi:hypothetical protein
MYSGPSETEISKPEYLPPKIKGQLGQRVENYHGLVGAGDDRLGNGN